MTRPDGPDGFVYELRTNTSGYYPCVKTSTLVYMEAGEVWKIRETTQINGGRYSENWLKTIGAGGVEQIPVFYGNQREIKILEKGMIYGYFIQNGHLPPGNKIFR
jgi:hypothetical protein